MKGPIPSECKNQDNASARRPLLAEFCVLGFEEVAVFLLPLWEETAPIVERIKVKHSALWLMAGSFLKAVEKMRQESETESKPEAQIIFESKKEAARDRIERMPEEMEMFIRFIRVSCG